MRSPHSLSVCDKSHRKSLREKSLWFFFFFLHFSFGWILFLGARSSPTDCAWMSGKHSDTRIMRNRFHLAHNGSQLQTQARAHFVRSQTAMIYATHLMGSLYKWTSTPSQYKLRNYLHHTYACMDWIKEVSPSWKNTHLIIKSFQNKWIKKSVLINLLMWALGFRIRRSSELDKK